MVNSEGGSSLEMLSPTGHHVQEKKYINKRKKVDKYK